jgi:hypothetical protein
MEKCGKNGQKSAQNHTNQQHRTIGRVAQVENIHDTAQRLVVSLVGPEIHVTRRIIDANPARVRVNDVDKLGVELIQRWKECAGIAWPRVEVSEPRACRIESSDASKRDVLVGDELLTHAAEQVSTQAVTDEVKFVEVVAGSSHLQEDRVDERCLLFFGLKKVRKKL